MKYQVKEIYYTLQGEGAQAGRPAVFCRFAGCNLWSGREIDRSSAKCWFCDTDFVGTDGPGGGTFSSAVELAEAIRQKWPVSTGGTQYAVFTGGEPLLQLDEKLILAVHEQGFEIGVESNGTIAAPDGINWLTISPKPNSELVQRSGDELKLVYPHEVLPEQVADLPFRFFYLSPRTTVDAEENRQHVQQAVQYCRDHPQWRLTMQYHRIWGIP